MSALPTAGRFPVRRKRPNRPSVDNASRRPWCPHQGGQFTMRVRQGGHGIPAEVIRRRFKAGLSHFCDIYRSRVDFWQMIDNSGEVPVLLEEGANL